MNNEFEVIIVGGGIAGWSLALQLLKLGINTSCLFLPNNNNKSGVDDLSIDELKSIYNKRININNDTFELIRLGFINIEGI